MFSPDQELLVKDFARVVLAGLQCQSSYHGLLRGVGTGRTVMWTHSFTTALEVSYERRSLK